MLQLEYPYDTRNLVTPIDESDMGGLVEWVSFTYDDRGRLIGEVRRGAAPYDRTYTYDQVGRVGCSNEAPPCVATVAP